MVNRIVGFDAAKRLVFGNPDLLVPGASAPNLLTIPVGGVKSRELLPTMTRFMCPSSSHSKEDSNYPNSEQWDTFYCHVIMRF